MPLTFVIFIETLTGTEFEVRVSPNETILSLKARIQRAEGIPISQQHLIYNDNELTNDSKIRDYNLSEGSTLKLVLAMRGGPVNMRKVQIADDPAMLDMNNFLEMNRNELWQQLPSGLQVTLLVFRDGDQVNFYRVAETEGNYSPLHESWSGSSIRNLFGDDDEEWQSRMKENEEMQSKMMNLQKEMGKKAKKKRKTSARPKYIRKAQSPRNEATVLPAIKPTPRLWSEEEALSSSLNSNPSKKKHTRRHTEKTTMGSLQNASSSNLAKDYFGFQRSSLTDGEPYLESHSMVTNKASTTPRNRNLTKLKRNTTLEDSVKNNEVKKTTRRRRRSDSKKPEKKNTSSSVPFPPIYPSGRSSRLAEPPSSLERWHTYNAASTPSLRGSSIEEEEEEDNQNAMYTFPENSNGNRTKHKIRPPEMRSRVANSGASKLNSNKKEKKQKDIPQLSSASTKKEIDINNYIERRRLPIFGDSRPKTSPATAFSREGWEAPMSPALSTRSERSYQYASEKRGHRLCEILKPIGEDRPTLHRSDDARRQSIEARVARDLFMEIFADEDIRQRSISRSTFRKGLGKMVVTANKEARDQIRDAIGERIASSRGKTSSPTYKVSPRYKNGLPPVSPKKPRKPKCAHCGKKLGLATTFSCHCGKVFCGQDRYAEVHNCTYDYKHQGRKLIEQANPVVTAQKLPKI